MEIQHDIRIEPDYRSRPAKTTILWRKMISRPQEFEHRSTTETLRATLLTIRVKLNREVPMHNGDRKTFSGGGEYTNES